MKAFAALVEGLVYTPSRNAKLRLIADYLDHVPDPDRGWGLAALTGALSFAAVKPGTIRGLAEARSDPELFRWSYDYVGDLAETVALIWREPEQHAPPPALGQVVDALTAVGRSEAPALVERWLDRLVATERLALLKLVTGNLRVGVSARLAKVALAGWAGRDPAEIEEVWHGLSPPYGPLFDWLEGRAERPDPAGLPVFRPLMLAQPLEEGELDSLLPGDFRAEWKWDGIRVQLVATGRGGVRIFSRGGDDVTGAFPEIAEAMSGEAFHGVADGELLVVRDGEVAPFNDLQQRLNRKRVTAAMLERYPAWVRLYDLLFDGAEDIRPLAFEDRRRRLEAWYERHRPSRMDLSPLIAFEAWPTLVALRAQARANAIEGLMLKRADSPYVAGRPAGLWYKWKRGALTADCVLMYAQRGHGKRSSFYSDYTFGAWRLEAGGARRLVPVGKAYFGFTDEELLRLDRWVRNHTVNRFGPVREVAPGLVLEIAFDSIHPSTRHKSGLAMRFPRVHRIRWDKPAEEADLLETLEAMVAGGPDGENSRGP